MCGVGFIYSKNGLPIQERALDEFVQPLERRGPDKVVISHVQNRYCMVNSILSIKGNAWPYSDCSKRRLFRTTPNPLESLFAFNGEIYDWDKYADSDTYIDTDHICDLVRRNDFSNLYDHYSGFFSFLELTFKDGCPYITYGTDTLGEKPLFVYSDPNYLVVCSTIKSIVRFLRFQGLSLEANTQALSRYFLTRHYLFLGDSPFNGIKKIEGGRVYRDNLITNNSTCIYDSALKLTPDFKTDLDIFDVIEKEAYSDALNHKSAFILSGGIDSSLTSSVASFLARHSVASPLFVTLTFGQRDLAALQARQQALSIGIREFQEIPVSVDSYQASLDSYYLDYYIPACTHSFISNDILCRYLSANGFRLLYGGEGADELFQGYEAYKNLFDTVGVSPVSFSPYSSIESSTKFGTPIDYSSQCDVEYIKSYLDRYSGLCLSTNDHGFLLDATLQLQSTGNLCADLTGSHYGIESRSPFVNLHNLRRISQSIQTFRNTRSCKSVLRRLFLSRYDQKYLMPKQGYSGFPNEAASCLLKSSKFPLSSDLLGLNVFNRIKDLDRSLEWKLYNMELFLERCI